MNSKHMFPYVLIQIFYIFLKVWELLDLQPLFSCKPHFLKISKTDTLILLSPLSPNTTHGVAPHQSFIN